MSDKAKNDWEQYRKDRSETAFRAMMEAHAGQIHAVALRRCDGRVDWAREATQAVFGELARKAESLPTDTLPGGWLHRCAIFKSLEILRSETRRRKYEREAGTDPGLSAGTWPDRNEVGAEEYEHLHAQLAAAVESLPGRDRQVLKLRFYEGLSLRQTGQALGINEDTAQKRTSRALGGHHPGSQAAGGPAVQPRHRLDRPDACGGTGSP